MKIPYRAKSTRQRAGAFATAVLSVLMNSVFVPTAVHAAEKAGTGAVTHNPDARNPQGIGRETGFLQVRDNGKLYYYEWHDSTSKFSEHKVDDGGWGNTKIVALLGRFTTGASPFVEVKGDTLYSWELYRDGSRFAVRSHGAVDTGWSNTRLIAGVGDIRGDGGFEFIQVRDNGDLMLYLSRGTGYVFEDWLDNGYEHARLMAGAQWIPAFGGQYVVVNDVGDLWEYTIPSDPAVKPRGTRRMSGWQNVRLLGPGGTVYRIEGWSQASFVSIRYSGELFQWHRKCDDATVPECNWQEGYRDTNWFNARLIG